MKIYKQPLEVMPAQAVEMPVGAKVLCVQTQNGRPTIWYEFDGHDTAARSRFIYVVPTGADFEIKEPHRYVGTAQTGPLVWHIYEEILQ